MIWKIFLILFCFKWRFLSLIQGWMEQGDLKKKEMQLNLCNIFSVLVFNDWPNTLNRVKLERAFTFIKYLDSAVALIFLPKTLIWNNITFPASNLLSILEQVVKELLKSISKKVYQYSFYYSIYHCLIKKF